MPWLLNGKHLAGNCAGGVLVYYTNQTSLSANSFISNRADIRSYKIL